MDAIALTAAASPIPVRVAVGIAGAVLLLAGARVYRPALFLAGFGAGAAASVTALAVLAVEVPAAGDPMVVVAGAAIGGLLAALITGLVHRVGLIAVGGIIGAIAGGTVADLAWWAPLVGALLGAVAMPWLYPALLKLVTPAVGAALIVWASGTLEPWWFAGLWIVGAAVQIGLFQRSEAADLEESS